MSVKKVSDELINKKLREYEHTKSLLNFVDAAKNITKKLNAKEYIDVLITQGLTEAEIAEVTGRIPRIKGEIFKHSCGNQKRLAVFRGGNQNGKC